MLTEAEKLEIGKILEVLTPTRLSKLHLKKLQKIKNAVTRENDNRCLCAAVDRTKFYNEFLVWYQKNAWRLHNGELRRSKGLYYVYAYTSTNKQKATFNND